MRGSISTAFTKRKRMISKCPGSENWALAGQHMAQWSHMADLWAPYLCAFTYSTAYEISLGDLILSLGAERNSAGAIKKLAKLHKYLLFPSDHTGFIKAFKCGSIRWVGGKASKKQNWYQSNLISTKFIDWKLWQVWYVSYWCMSVNNIKTHSGQIQNINWKLYWWMSVNNIKTQCG